ncbi:glucose-6-phosphate isomerase [Actinomyces minihominis]|uniref:glucose-6-phosphate isomerase n=1 Tax=Actinomyces minihominis TaxID=2002838 RepID=UPI000C077336|nr:glucose-6-phosphate isomerase [Actinomyces minihominis]
MGKPVDPSGTAPWDALEETAGDFVPDLAGWFADNPDRARDYTFSAADLHVDLSKNLLTDEVVEKLLQLAEATGVEGHRNRMFRGDRINVTEDRAVLHTALRNPEGTSVTVDGEDVMPAVHAELKRVYSFAEKVREGSWTGITGKPIETVVNIGIGGSDLGPVMVYEALKPFAQDGLEARFISNIDPTDAADTVRDLDPETTLVIVTSKTFTTLETITNARVVRSWLLEKLAEKGVIEGPGSESAKEAVAKHFVAVSTALDRVADFGINPDNAFGFWDWVGGRYSVSSAVGTVLAIVLGPTVFEEFLSGLHAMDQHFITAPAEKNVPLLMGLLNVWYVNFLGSSSHAVLPYSQYLHRFPAYLQQMTMESNGKGVRWDGAPVSYDTGEVFWGEPGTNGQHAFYQLLHQGTQLIPADFIAFANPAWPLVDGEKDMHELFLSNFFAQTKALAFGKSEDEVRAEGTAEDLVPARVFTGNRPTTSIMAPALTPSVLGQLVALYEHLTFVEGAVWGVDSFDQWGVELGKVLAMGLLPAIEGNREVLEAQDPSTRGLIEYYLKNRKR